MYTYKPRAQEVEAGRPGLQGYPWLHTEFEASMKYTKLCQKTKQNKKAKKKQKRKTHKPENQTK